DFHVTGVQTCALPIYKGIEEYFKVSMNAENIIPKTSEAIAISIVPFDKTSQKFLDQMVYNGKITTLQDAFLPHLPDYLKMNATADRKSVVRERVWYLG